MTRTKAFVIAIAAAVFLTAAVAVIFMSADDSLKLIVCDAESQKIYAEFDVFDGEELSVSYIHSVNITEVFDVYYVNNDSLVCDKQIYSSFGAGMPTEWDDDWTVSYEDGKMTISGLNMKAPQNGFTYIVGTVYDHVLHIGGEDIVLNEICGKNARITLKIKTPVFGG